MKSFGAFVIFLSYCLAGSLIDCYEVPSPKIELLEPKGFSVSIPHKEGVTLFAFHGNVNKKLQSEREAGEMAVDVLRQKNGRWTYQNKNIELKDGDTIHYWLYVIKDGLGYERLNQHFDV